MILLSHHKHIMADRETQIKKLDTFAANRKPHLIRLKKIEQLIRSLAPLPMSYDVGRNQPPFFNEFSYTEMMGGIMVTPQSSIVQAEMIVAALLDKDIYSLNIDEMFQHHLEKEGDLDKYNLKHITNGPKKIVFPPGSNSFSKHISKENLSRLMFEDREVFIKPHPLSDEGLLRMLGIEYGFHRILPPDESGWDYLMKATDVWCSSTTELGLYAVYLEKPIYNIGNFFNENSAVYNGFYRVLWKLGIDKRKNALMKILTNPLSGWIHPDDTNIEERLKQYFTTAMNFRETHVPLIMDIPPLTYAIMASGGNAKRKPPRKEKINGSDRNRGKIAKTGNRMGNNKRKRISESGFDYKEKLDCYEIKNGRSGERRSAENI